MSEYTLIKRSAALAALDHYGPATATSESMGGRAAYWALHGYADALWEDCLESRHSAELAELAYKGLPLPADWVEAL